MAWYERYMDHPGECKCRGCERIGAYNAAIAVRSHESVPVAKGKDKSFNAKPAAILAERERGK